MLIAAFWCQSEINNGGLHQFFWNSTGVLAPEGVEAFRTIGMPQTAAAIEKAMLLFGPQYSRDRAVRHAALDALWQPTDDGEGNPFDAIDQEFYAHFETENGGFEAAADAYAARSE